MNTILGIDPGFDRVGWAVGQVVDKKLQVWDFGCIQTDKQQIVSERYQAIDDQLTAILTKYKPADLAIESLFFFKNAKSVMRVSEARGAIISCCLRHQLQLFEYPPLQIKQAVTGNGRADKTAVAKMVKLQLKLPEKIVGGKIETKIIDDAMDAIAILLTHALMSRSPKL